MENWLSTDTEHMRKNSKEETSLGVTRDISVQNAGH